MGLGNVPTEWDNEESMLSEKAKGKRRMESEEKDDDENDADDCAEDSDDDAANVQHSRKKRLLNRLDEEEDDDFDEHGDDSGNQNRGDASLNEETREFADAHLIGKSLRDENNAGEPPVDDDAPPVEPAVADGKAPEAEEEPDLTMHEFFFITAKGRVHPRVCDMLRYRKKEPPVEIILEGEEKPIARGRLRPTAKQVHAIAVSCAAPEEGQDGDEDTQIAWAYRDNGEPTNALHTFTDQMKGAVKKELSKPGCPSTLKKQPQLMVTITRAIDLDLQVKSRGWYLVPKEKAPKPKAPSKPRAKKDDPAPSDGCDDAPPPTAKQAVNPAAVGGSDGATSAPITTDGAAMEGVSQRKPVAGSTMDTWVQRKSQAPEPNGIENAPEPIAPTLSNDEPASSALVPPARKEGVAAASGAKNTQLVEAHAPRARFQANEMHLVYNTVAHAGVSTMNIDFGFPLPMDAEVRIVVSGGQRKSD